MKKQVLYVSAALLAMCAMLYSSCRMEDNESAIVRGFVTESRGSEVDGIGFTSRQASSARQDCVSLEGEDTVSRVRKATRSKDDYIDSSTTEISEKASKNIGVTSGFTLMSYKIEARPEDESLGTVRLTADGMEVTTDVYHGATMVAEVVSVAGNYEFVNWTVDDEVVSTALSYVFTATENVEVVANFRRFTLRAVDLGLSVRWANANLGASSPDHTGHFYSWGEVKAFNEEDPTNTMNYEHNNPHSYRKTYFSWSTYKYSEGINPYMTKYCSDADYGVVDHKMKLDPMDDASTVLLGEGWHIPNDVEMRELVSRCIWKWAEFNGMSGYQIFGPNGNSIFLPAAGCRGYSSRRSANSGYYWMSLVDESYQCNARCLYFYANHVSSAFLGRYLGQSIRPVCK